VLPDGEIQHNVLQKWCNLYACVHGRQKDFFRGVLVDFSKSLSRAAKLGETCFLPLETKKTAFFAELFKFLPLFRHPWLCVGKNSCHTFKKLA